MKPQNILEQRIKYEEKNKRWVAMGKENRNVEDRLVVNTDVICMLFWEYE